MTVNPTNGIIWRKRVNTNITDGLLAPVALTQTKPDDFVNNSLFVRVRREKESISMRKQMFRERECIHREEDAHGEFYNGAFYVQALQRLSVDQALQVAGRIGSFFWVDAPHTLVWLCDECATELNLADTPRALTQARRA